MSRYYDGNNDADFNDFLIDDYLEHWGVLGMHWGIRKDTKSGGGIRGALKKRKQKKNLAKARKTREANLKAKKELEKKKIEILKSPTKMMKNQKLFTTQEIKDWTDRANAESNLNVAAINKLNAGRNYANMALNYVKTAKDAYSVLSSSQGQAITRVLNSALGLNVPIAPNTYEDFSKYYGSSIGVSSKIAENVAAYNKNNAQNNQNNQKKEE